MAALRLEHLRRHAVGRSLFRPTTLGRAVARLGFVQADPIRAPARAQDLILRHRVRDYRAGDLEAKYTRLRIEEDFFVNYGFLPREVYQLMHPRAAMRTWDDETQRRAAAMLAFVRARGRGDPREVEAEFAHGKVRNYWGGSSNATTHLLDGMHYRGMLRVLRRDRGTRIYAAHDHAPATLDPDIIATRLDVLIDIAVGVYAPVPARSLTPLLRRLRYGVPQCRAHLDDAIARAKGRLARARVDGIEWYWPDGESPVSNRYAPAEEVRFLTPFDPVVWDRLRFEILWGWTYRFEAYTPGHKRKLGYYALPLLWRDQVIGWANANVVDGKLVATTHYRDRAPRDPAYKRALEAERERLRAFLRL